MVRDSIYSWHRQNGGAAPGTISSSCSWKKKKQQTMMEHQDSICSPGMSYESSPAAHHPQYHEMQPAPPGMTTPVWDHPAHQSAANAPQLSTQSQSHFRVAEWQVPYDSGVQSLQPSQEPSIMSMPMPGSSRMSMVSVTETVELTEEQQQKFEHINLSFDAAQPESCSAAIPHLIGLINDPEEVVAAKALQMIRMTAKRDTEARFQKPIIHQQEAITAIIELLENRENSPALIRNALGALFFISNRPEGVRLVFVANQQLNGLMLRKLIDFIRYPNTPFQKWAIPLLHTLLADSKASGQNIRMAQEWGALQALTYRLFHEVSEKLLTIIVQTLMILCSKHQEQTKIFFHLQGPERLVFILHNFQYEGLLDGATRLLNKLTPHAAELVQFQAPFALCRGLQHASPRLVEHSLECLRNLSHIRNMQNQPEIIQAVLQLFGASKIKLLQHCMDILINMCAESKANKEILCRNHNTIPYLISILSAPNYPSAEDREGKAREALQETVLRLLKILCNEHQFQKNVQDILMNQMGCIWIMLQTMRPKLIWRTLQLMMRLASNEAYLNKFAETRLMQEGQMGFAKLLVYILKVACNNLSESKVDDVKVVDILQSAITVLNLFCRHPHLRDQIAYELMLPENMCVKDNRNLFLPIFVLQEKYPGKDEKAIKQTALTIIASTVTHPQVAARFRCDPGYMAGLQQLCQLPDYAQLAERALRVLHESSQQPYPPLRCAPAPAGMPDRRFPPQRPSSPTEPALPEDLAALDPFVNVFCPNGDPLPQNSPPFSPHLPVAATPSQQPRPPAYDVLPPMHYPDSYNYPAAYGAPPAAQYPPSAYYPTPSQQPYPTGYYDHCPPEYRYHPG